MKPILSVPESLLGAIRDLVGAEQIALEVTAKADGAVRVQAGDQRRECDLAVLHQGGWITCHTARAMASRLQIANASMGKLLESLSVKVRRCDLGCFQ